MCLALATVASAAPQFLGHHGVAHHGVVGHHAAVHAPVLPTAVSGSVAPVNYGANKPVNGYGHGQVSHQSVSKPYQGEHRSTTQSKAFGAHAAVVADAPNRLHGADAVVSHGVHAVHAPLAHHGVAHAVHAPVVAHAVHAPVVAHAAPAYHAPIVHAAPAYKAAPAYHAPAETYADEVSPYTYTYAVADDYSKASFNAEEQSDGASNVAGGYSVALPDGRIQHVKYTSNAYDGYVADVTYEGTAVYPEAPAPGYHAAPAPAYHA